MVDDDLRPLKSGQTCLSVSVCANDTASSNPTTPGRGAADDHAHTTNSCFVYSCGSVFCGVLSVLCSCVLFLCVSEVEVVIPFCSFLYISLRLVCYTQ